MKKSDFREKGLPPPGYPGKRSSARGLPIPQKCLPAKGLPPKRGFSLVEILVAMGVFFIIFAILISTLSLVLAVQDTVLPASEKLGDLGRVLFFMEKEIEWSRSGALAIGTATLVVSPDLDGGGTPDYQVRYTYDPALRRLIRQVTGQGPVNLLGGIASMSFSGNERGVFVDISIEELDKRGLPMFSTRLKSGASPVEL